MAGVAEHSHNLSLPVALRVEGRKIEEVREELHTKLSMALGCPISVSTQDAPALMRADLS